MEVKQRYFFKKEEKLKSRKVIQQLFQKGAAFSNYPFKVTWILQEGKGQLQTGVGVSNRYFKKATDRNRIKRLMRESYRLQKNELAGFIGEKRSNLSVFIIYVGKDIPEYDLVFEKTGIIINRLINFVNEKH